MSSNQLILGVDAGGTKTAAWLAAVGSDGTPVVLGRGRAGSGNPMSVGFGEATRAISEAIAEARRHVEPSSSIARAVLSIAGAANRKTSDHILDWARSARLAAQVAVCSDFLPVLAAGTARCQGIALIAGTGSVAFARTGDGRAARFGGWGYLLGDDGSGYSIGRASIRTALKELESLALKARPDELEATQAADDKLSGERHRLTKKVVERLGVASVSELTSRIYSDSQHRATIASLASLVVEAADAGDEAASAILDEAAADLTDLVVRAATMTEMRDRPVPLAVSGGLLVGSPRLRAILEDQLLKREIPCVIQVVADPLQGCLRLAMPGFAVPVLEWS